MSYLLIGNSEQALKDFCKAIELNPEDDISHFNRGIIYTEKGDYEAAIKDYSKAIEINPDYIDAYFNRASTYSYKGDYDKAIEDLQTCLKIKPDTEMRNKTLEIIDELTNRYK